MMTSIRTGLLLAAWLSAAASALAADTPVAPALAATPLASAVAETQALRAVRDKESGRLRAASAQEMAEMDAAARDARVARGEPADPTPTPLVVRRHANGMRSAVLGPEHMVTLQGRRDAIGRIVQSHDRAAHEHPTHQQAVPTE